MLFVVPQGKVGVGRLGIASEKLPLDTNPGVVIIS